MQADRKSVRIRIEGRVQGVGFRAWVVMQAQALGLFGWVANRRDGGVEAVVTGDPRHVDAMVALCRQGPPSARVDWIAIHDEPAPVVAFDGFAVHPTR